MTNLDAARVEFQGRVDPDRNVVGCGLPVFARQRKAVELAAMEAVMAKERELGYEPVDVSDKDLGWDIESRIPGTGKLRFIEVKGGAEGATTVTDTKNEILAGLNKPEDFFLAIVEVAFEGEKAVGGQSHYIPKPFQREPDFAATRVNYKWRELLLAQNHKRQIP